MVSLFVIVSLLVAAFVGIDIGGSSTGVAFGLSVGSRLVGKPSARGVDAVRVHCDFDHLSGDRGGIE